MTSSFRVRHRGPDWSGCHVSKNNILCHERLAIVGVGKVYQKKEIVLYICLTYCVTIDSGAQPLVSEDGNIVLCVNGEIYNHKHLRNQLKQPHHFQTHSDCEVIMHMVNIQGGAGA